jgi:hypothetical protein
VLEYGLGNIKVKLAVLQGKKISFDHNLLVCPVTQKKIGSLVWTSFKYQLRPS